MGISREVAGPHSKKVMWPSYLISKRARPTDKGFSLAELLVVVVIVGIVAVVAIPTFSSNDGKKVDVATNEVVQALRFSRSEAMRAGTHHGVRITADQERLQVFWLDLAPVTPTERFTIYDPISKKLYEENVKTSHASTGVLATADFRYAIPGSPVWAVAFNARGEPVASSDLNPMLSGSIVLNLGNFSKTITVAPVTGRVTVQ